MKRLKVLVSAYTCSPYQGSEPAVGWGFVSALSEYHDLSVIVEEEKWRQPIEQYLDQYPEFSERVKFYFIRKKRNRWLRKLWPPSYYWYYRVWHWDAFLLAQKLNEEVKFDLVHQLTMVGFREPGYLWRLNIPFVWGPVGGMGLFPWRFINRIGLYGAIFYTGRNIFNLFHMYLLRRPRLAASKAGSGLVAATSENNQNLKKHYNCESRVIAEVGLPPGNGKKINKKSSGEPLVLVWSGQHKPGKALNLGLEALSCLHESVNWKLNVLGGGHRTEAWKKESRRLKIDNKVNFHGLLSRSEALDVMGEAHVMLITSLKDLTSTVTIEALAYGLPLICPDHCGFQDAVTPECGIRVSVSSPKVMIEGITEAIARLANDEKLRQNLALGALERSKLYDWSRKGELMNEVYQQTVRAFE